MIQRDDIGWEVGGEFRIGNSCTPVADSYQCMAKPIQYCKKNKVKIKIKKNHIKISIYADKDFELINLFMIKSLNKMSTEGRYLNVIKVICSKSFQSCLILCNPVTVTYQAPLSTAFSKQE